MAKIIKNNVRGQVSDYIVRYQAFKDISYNLAVTDTDTLSVRTVSLTKLEEMTGCGTPAAVFGDTIYVSELFHRLEQPLKEFILAHEVGHWVTGEDLVSQQDTPDYIMESELAADSFAMSLYPEKEYKDAARQSLLEMVVTSSHLMTSFTPERLSLMSVRLRVVASRLMLLK